MPETTAEQLAELISGYTDLKKYFESVRAEMDQRLDEMTEIIEGKKAIPQEDWTDIQDTELHNGWETYNNDYNSPGFFKDSLGIVHLKGLVRKGTDQLILKLPPDYYPAKRELHAACTHPNTMGRIDITIDGEVKMVHGHKGWISLDGITFRAK